MNDHTFKTIDTAEKAYWLGFLFADGAMKKAETIQLCLSTKDESQIFEFIKFLDDKNPNIKYYGPYKTSGKQIHYYVKNKNIHEDLIKLGCVFKKSKIIEFPRINKELNGYFLLGYYDGDGCAGSPVITSGSKKFLLQVKKIFKIKQNVRHLVNTNGEVFSLNIGVDLFSSLIKDTKIGIQRKRFIRYRKTELGKKRDHKIQKKLSLIALKKELEKNISFKEIAKNMGVHRNTVYRAIKKL